MEGGGGAFNVVCNYEQATGPEVYLPFLTLTVVEHIKPFGRTLDTIPQRWCYGRLSKFSYRCYRIKY